MALQKKTERLIILSFVIVGALTLAAGFYIWHVLGPVELSLHGWLAIAAGVVFSFLLGGALMALSFYSARRGYDDAAAQPDPFGPPKV